jgi:hypothetical protein
MSQLLSTFVPTFISSAVVWIAWSQHQTNRQKLKLDLYNRRFSVYEKTINYHMSWWKPDNDIETIDKCAAEFSRAVSESPFLFGKNSTVHNILIEIAQAMAILCECKKKLIDPSKEENSGVWLKQQEKEIYHMIELMERLQLALLEWLDFSKIER